MMRIIYSLIIFLQLLNAGVSQHIPELINYKTSEYKAHNQNWSITQSSDRWMYFANTDGLLVFNGNSWAKYTLPGRKIIRSVFAKDKRIYTGAYGEFGYWERDECGDHHYQSLTQLITGKAIEKEEIWKITSEDNIVYFQSFSVLLKYDGQTISRITLPGSIMFLYHVNGKEIIQCMGSGLYEIVGNKISLMEGSRFFADKIVTGIVRIPNSTNKEGILISTNTNGLFTLNAGQIKEWNTLYQTYFSESQVNKIHVTSNNLLIIGTIRDGLKVFNADKTLRYRINTLNGLQNNTVLAIHEDVDGNIWLGLDRGISMLKMKEDVLFFKDEAGKLGTVYTMAQNGDFLYIGTNQGVYYCDNKLRNQLLKSVEFKLVRGTQGQVWELKNVGGTLLCGHNDGTFVIKNGIASKISNVTGGWFSTFLPGKTTEIIQGTYTGLVIFKQFKDSWKFSHRVAGFTEPVKKIVQLGKNKFWVTGPNTGLTRLTLDEDSKNVIATKKYSQYNSTTIIESPDINFLFGKLIVNDGRSQFSYDVTNDAFIESLNSKNENFLIRNINDTLWMKIYSDSLLLMREQNKVFTFIGNANRDYHNVTYLRDNTIGICLNEGYAMINQNVDISKLYKMPLSIYKIVTNDIEKCIPIDQKVNPVLNYTSNSFTVHFFGTSYGSSKNYRYRLLPDNNEWKQVSDPDFITFNNLPSDEYELQIKDDTLVSSILFTVLPPWYKSFWAIICYLLMLGVTVWFLQVYFENQLKYQKLKLEKENERLIREQLIAMENDRLTQSNISKSKELANATMHLIQKNELLQEIKDELIEVRKTGDHTLTTKDFQIMMKQINDNLTVQDDKNLFNANFEDVHEVFLKKLKASYPDLTSDDLKLAAYLKMNLTSKDIAPLFNISIRGLENKRYRLRKKMNLAADENLADFFNKYS